MTKTREGPGQYLGKRVFVEAFGRRRHGTICGVYRHGENVEVEIESNDGEMIRRPLKALHFTDGIKA